MMGKLGTIPGVFAFLRPYPVLEISTGATNQNQGQVRVSRSRGSTPSRSTTTAGKLMAKLAEYPGFVTMSSDFFNNTPNLDIELRRDQAKMYGVSESRILRCSATAYSQNYVYLIKKPTDQYQVILEVDGRRRARSPQDLKLLYIRSDDGKRIVPLTRRSRLEADARPAGGEPPQPVHQRHARTST